MGLQWDINFLNVNFYYVTPVVDNDMSVHIGLRATQLFQHLG